MRYIWSCISRMHLSLKCNSLHDYNVDEMHVEEIVVVAKAVNRADVMVTI